MKRLKGYLETENKGLSFLGLKNRERFFGNVGDGQGGADEKHHIKIFISFLKFLYYSITPIFRLLLYIMVSLRIFKVKFFL